MTVKQRSNKEITGKQGEFVTIVVVVVMCFSSKRGRAVGRCTRVWGLLLVQRKVGMGRADGKREAFYQEGKRTVTVVIITFPPLLFWIPMPPE